MICTSMTDWQDMGGFARASTTPIVLPTASGHAVLHTCCLLSGSPSTFEQFHDAEEWLSH